MSEQVLMNEYRVTFEDGKTDRVVRDSIVPVAADFEDRDNPITQIQRTRTGLNVALPYRPPNVQFRTSVTPPAAVDGGCLATPQVFTVPEGQKVILQALVAEGFSFDGWYLTAPVNPEDTEDFDAEVPFSVERTTELVITAPSPGAQRVIVARFSAG